IAQRVNFFLIRGTWINASAVALGGTVGVWAGSALPEEYSPLALSAIGVGTIAMGGKMFLSTWNVLIPVASLVFGALLGRLMGIQQGVQMIAEGSRSLLASLHGGDLGYFQEAFISSSLLFCVGPMTLLGCLEDGLEGRITLLSVKSLLDGVSSLFIGAGLGPGVLLSTLTILAVQMPLTLGARKLRFLKDESRLIQEISATGGLILIVIGLSLCGLKLPPSSEFLPALVLAGIFAEVARRFFPSVPKS
ncbi:MAG: DUF554 domain-containing protein, partial [Candidatus Caldarchaeum sp.]